MAMVSFYVPWPEVSCVFRIKRDQFNLQLITLLQVTEDSLYSWKASYKMKLPISSSNTYGEFISYNEDKTAFGLFNLF